MPPIVIPWMAFHALVLLFVVCGPKAHGQTLSSATVSAVQASLVSEKSHAALGTEPPTAGPAAQAETDASYDIHFQETVVEQGHPEFHAPYSGNNSLRPASESATSVTSTLFLGWRPFRRTELYVDPELSGGQGMSDALGVAGFPNGEAYRIGDPRPTMRLSRLYVQKIIGFGQDAELVQDQPNQLAGTRPKRRLTLWAGKFGAMDWFDDNAYSHDPRTQFMNWALANSGAWDYPADTYGYTWGLADEYHAPSWALRGGAVAEPKVANQTAMDRRIGRAHGFMIEGEHQSPFEGYPGTLRLLLYFNDAHMGNYDQAVALARQTDTTPDIAQTRAYGHSKYGFTSSDDLRLSDTLGGFSRLSWDDGRDETWAYTEIDGSAALGLDWKAARWNRPDDHWGIAQVVNVLSNSHRRYLADGGYGFLIGDGALHYGPELITETFYRIQWKKWLQISPDVQFVINPAYNRNRGPVPVWGLRVHAEF